MRVTIIYAILHSHTRRRCSSLCCSFPLLAMESYFGFETFVILLISLIFVDISDIGDICNEAVVCQSRIPGHI